MILRRASGRLKFCDPLVGANLASSIVVDERYVQRQLGRASAVTSWPAQLRALRGLCEAELSCRTEQLTSAMRRFDLMLDFNMSLGLNSQRTALGLTFSTGQGTLDVRRPWSVGCSCCDSYASEIGQFAS